MSDKNSIIYQCKFVQQIANSHLNGLEIYLLVSNNFDFQK